MLPPLWTAPLGPDRSGLWELTGVPGFRKKAHGKTASIPQRRVQAPGRPRSSSIVALSVWAAIDDPGRFAKSPSLGAYLGLTPRRYASGEVDSQGRITKRGDPVAPYPVCTRPANVSTRRASTASGLIGLWGLKTRSAAASRRPIAGRRRSCGCVAPRSRHRIFQACRHRVPLGQRWGAARQPAPSQAILPAPSGVPAGTTSSGERIQRGGALPTTPHTTSRHPRRERHAAAAAAQPYRSSRVPPAVDSCCYATRGGRSAQATKPLDRRDWTHHQGREREAQEDGAETIAANYEIVSQRAFPVARTAL